MSQFAMKQQSYYHLELPQELNASSLCAIFLTEILTNSDIGIPVHTITSQSNVTIPKIVGASGKTKANGIGPIIQWVGRQRVEHKIVLCLQQLCGTGSKSVYSRISIALKRVEDWEPNWRVNATSNISELENPLCKARLLDRLIMHSKVRYLVQYKWIDAYGDDKTAPSHITIADIAHFLILAPWMHFHEANKELICSSLPNVIAYMQHIRQEYLTWKHKWLNPNKHYVIDDYMLHMCSWIGDVSDSSVSVNTYARYADAKRTATQRKKENGMSLKINQNLNSSLRELSQKMLSSCVWSEFMTLTGKSVSPAVNNTDESSTYTNASNSLSNIFWTNMSLPPKRISRKKQQILSLAVIASCITPPRGIVVEFCCGGGYVGLAVAALRPDVSVVLTDRNSVSLSFAQERVNLLGLRNVFIRLCDLSDVVMEMKSTKHSQTQPNRLARPGRMGNDSTSIQDMMASFDVGIALHACGRATDIVQHICVQANASFVIAPCCYGFIQHWEELLQLEKTNMSYSPKISEENKLNEMNMALCSNCNRNCSLCECYSCGGYPRSNTYKDAGWKSEWFGELCSRADRTFWSHDDRASIFNEDAIIAMKIIDIDRLLFAKEKGYDIYGTHMHPIEASPKNHILVGKVLLQ
jgi:hypothetical protein